MSPEEHPTSNIEHRMAARILLHFGVRCSMLDVRCFPSVQGYQRANFHFREISRFALLSFAFWRLASACPSLFRHLPKLFY